MRIHSNQDPNNRGPPVGSSTQLLLFIDEYVLTCNLSKIRY